MHFFSHFRFKCGGCCWPIPLDWGTLILSNAQPQRIQMASQKSPSICKSLVFGKQFQSLRYIMVDSLKNNLVVSYIPKKNRESPKIRITKNYWKRSPWVMRIAAPCLVVVGLHFWHLIFVYSEWEDEQDNTNLGKYFQ